MLSCSVQTLSLSTLMPPTGSTLVALSSCVQQPSCSRVRVSRLLGEPELVPLLRWMSPALVINAISAIHATLFIKAMDFRRPTIRTLVGNALGGIVGVSMAVAHYGVWALIGAPTVRLSRRCDIPLGRITLSAVAKVLAGAPERAPWR